MNDINLERLIADLRALGEIGRNPDGGITRRALSVEDRAARRFVADRLRALGLEVRHDAVGNLRALRRGKKDLPSVMTGSHLDSVPSGGWLDGPLGVVGAVAAMEAIAGIETERPIEVAIFVGEEGSRFPRGTIGSAAMSGHVAVQDILQLRDSDNNSYEEALRTYQDEGAPLPCPVPRGSIDSYVELHIEQGGVLESEKIPIGAVTAIAGLEQERWIFAGDANHAGATPMDLRKDALTVAARWVLHVEDCAKKLGVVGTVGHLTVEPGGKNIIPGRVTAICDLRAPSKDLLDSLVSEVRQFAAGRDITIEKLQRVEPGPMDERAIAAVEIAAQRAGLGCRRMLSGAIHDALHMAEICPSSMIFVPSIGGKSHCPTEDTDPTHLAQGCEVLARTLLELAH